MAQMPRGLRNKNPGNIVKGQQWQGLSNDQPDSRFCTFNSYVYGCRALLKLLVTYTTKRDCTTVSKIITRYAPSNENDTKSYINSVSKFLNVEPSEELSFNKDTYINLGKAISIHENGSIAKEVLTDSIWEEAAKLAGL